MFDAWNIKRKFMWAERDLAMIEVIHPCLSTVTTGVEHSSALAYVLCAQN